MSPKPPWETNDPEKEPWHQDAGEWKGEPTGSDWEKEGEEWWRGEQHLRDWPESSCGPEYWMYKRGQANEEKENEQ